MKWKQVFYLFETLIKFEVSWQLYVIFHFRGSVLHHALAKLWLNRTEIWIRHLKEWEWRRITISQWLPTDWGEVVPPYHGPALIYRLVSWPIAMSMLDSVALLEAVLGSWKSRSAGTNVPKFYGSQRFSQLRNSSVGSSLDSLSSRTIERKSRILWNLNPEIFLTLEFEVVQNWTLIETSNYSGTGEILSILFQ